MRLLIDSLDPSLAVQWAPGVTPAGAGRALERRCRRATVSDADVAEVATLAQRPTTLGALRSAGVAAPALDALWRAKVLTACVPEPELLFDLELPPSPVGPETFLMPDLYENYKARCRRRLEREDTPGMPLGDHEIPDWLHGRRSVRRFGDTPVPQEAFETLLLALSARDDGTAAFGSAGALYPLDVYVHVKPGRVAGWQEGLYRLRPLSRSLETVTSPCDLPLAMQLPGNEEIAATSALTLFVFYDPLVSTPKYGGMGYYFGMLEAGALLHHAALVAHWLGLGSCQIGRQRFELAEKYFRLDPALVFLQSLEAGPVPTNEVSA